MVRGSYGFDECPKYYDEWAKVGDGELHTEPVYVERECEPNRIGIGGEESGQGELRLRGRSNADGGREYGIQLQQLEWGCERSDQSVYVDDQREQDADGEFYCDPGDRLCTLDTNGTLQRDHGDELQLFNWGIDIEFRSFGRVPV